MLESTNFFRNFQQFNLSVLFWSLSFIFVYKTSVSGAVALADALRQNSTLEHLAASVVDRNPRSRFFIVVNCTRDQCHFDFYLSNPFYTYLAICTCTFMTHYHVKQLIVWRLGKATMEAGDCSSKVPMTLDNMEQQLWLVPCGRIVTYWSWMYGWTTSEIRGILGWRHLHSCWVRVSGIQQTSRELTWKSKLEDHQILLFERKNSTCCFKSTEVSNDFITISI